MRSAGVIVVCLALVTPTLLFQQSVSYRIDEGTYPMQKGNQPGWQIEIKGADKQLVEKRVREWLKRFGGKLSARKGELMVNDVIVSSISEHPVDVYARVKGDGERAFVYVFFDMGGVFLNAGQHPQAWREARKMVDRLGKEIAREALKEIIREEEKKLEGMRKTLEKLETEKNRLEKEIEDCKKTIEENTQRIAENKQEQEELKKQIADQKAKIDRLNAQLKKLD